MTTPTEAELEIYDAHGTSATFAVLDAALGRSAVNGDTPLEKWYRAVSATRVEQLSDADLTRAVSQRQHLPVTIVEALRRLQKQALIGQNFPGELIDGIVQAPAWFWLGYAPLIETVRFSAESALALPELEAEARAHLTQFMSRVGAPSVLRIEIDLGGKRDVFALSPEQRLSIGSGPLASVRIPRELVALPNEALIFDALPTGVRLVASDPRATLNGAPLTSVKRLLGGEHITLGPLSVRVLVG